MKQVHRSEHKKVTVTYPRTTIIRRRKRLKAPLQEHTAMALQATGAGFCYLLYALFLSHSNRPWWAALILGPMILGSVPVIKHSIDAFFKVLLKRRNLHHRRGPAALATTMTGFIGTILLKVAVYYLG